MYENKRTLALTHTYLCLNTLELFAVYSNKQAFFNGSEDNVLLGRG